MFVIIFILSNINLFYSGYSVDSTVNQGYSWLVQNSPVPSNVEALDFDVMGYYHISIFPTEYNILGGITKINLVKDDSYYVVHLDFGGNNLLNIKWRPHPIGQYDDKIYSNDKINFYKEVK
jgi:hypothetical protein